MEREAPPRPRIPPKLLKEIRARSRLSRSRVYRLIDEKREAHNQVPDNVEAAALVAADFGIRLDHYFGPAFRTRLLQFGASPPAAALTSRARPVLPVPRATRPVTIKLGNVSEQSIPFVDPSMAESAKDMSVLYGELYLFENSARLLIKSLMEARFGPGWWQQVGRKTRSKVEERKEKEGKNRWHGGRGAHEIFYTDMDDLRQIIDSHWNGLFDQWFSERVQPAALFSEIEQSRNIIAHHNALSKQDRERLESNFGVWIRQTRR